MVSAWSIGKGKRSTIFFALPLIGSNYLNVSQSPGPAAYTPVARSKSPIPKWRYLPLLIRSSITTALREDASQQRNTPGPGAYFIPARSAGPKYHIASKLLSRSFLASPEKQPGPCDYSPNHSVIERRVTIKLKFGTKSKLAAILGGAQTPGPGAYNNGDEDNQKLTFHSPSGVKIGRASRNDTLARSRTEGPGPAAYLSLSRVSTLGCRFGKAPRDRSPRTPSPGPGAYSTREIVGKEGARPVIVSRRPDTSPRFGASSPGPCAYKIAMMRRTSGFTIGKQKRDRTHGNAAPGPLTYSPNDKPMRSTSPMWR